MESLINEGNIQKERVFSFHHHLVLDGLSALILG